MKKKQAPKGYYYSAVFEATYIKDEEGNWWKRNDNRTPSFEGDDGFLIYSISFDNYYFEGHMELLARL